MIKSRGYFNYQIELKEKQWHPVLQVLCSGFNPAHNTLSQFVATSTELFVYLMHELCALRDLHSIALDVCQYCCASFRPQDE